MQTEDALSGAKTPALLSSLILTAADKQEVIRVCGLLQQNIFRTNESEQRVITTNNNDSSKPPSLDLDAVVPRNYQPLFTQIQTQIPATQAAQLDELVKKVQQLPESVLYLSYQPTHYELKELVVLLRNKLSSELVVRAEFEPNIAGGFILETNGKRYSYSIKKLIRQFVTGIA